MLADGWPLLFRCHRGADWLLAKSIGLTPPSMSSRLTKASKRSSYLSRQRSTGSHVSGLLGTMNMPRMYSHESRSSTNSCSRRTAPSFVSPVPTSTYDSGSTTTSSSLPAVSEPAYASRANFRHSYKDHHMQVASPLRRRRATARKVGSPPLRISESQAPSLRSLSPSQSTRMETSLTSPGRTEEMALLISRTRRRMSGHAVPSKTTIRTARPARFC